MSINGVLHAIHRAVDGKGKLLALTEAKILVAGMLQTGLLLGSEIGLVDSLGTESFHSIPSAAKLLFQPCLSYYNYIPSIETSYS